MPKGQKKQSWKTGDVFTLPLNDESYGLGQVISPEPKAMNSAVIALFDYRFEQPPLSLNGIDLSCKRTLAVQFATRDQLDKHRWKVLQNAAIDDANIPRDLDSQREANFVGTKIRGSANIEDLLNAYHRLIPWDDYYDPTYLDQLLISSDRKPANVLLKNARPNPSP